MVESERWVKGSGEEWVEEWLGGVVGRREER